MTKLLDSLADQVGAILRLVVNLAQHGIVLKPSGLTSPISPSVRQYLFIQQRP